MCLHDKCVCVLNIHCSPSAQKLQWSGLNQCGGFPGLRPCGIFRAGLSSGLSSHWSSSHVVSVHVAPGSAANYSLSQRNCKPKNLQQIFSPNMSRATSQRKEKIIARTGIWLSLNDAARVWFMDLTVLMWHTSVCSQENAQFDGRLGSNQRWNKGRAVLSEHFSYPLIFH